MCPNLLWSDLEQEFDELCDAEARESELRDAKKRREELSGEIKAFQSELDKIPVQYQRPVTDVQFESAGVAADLQRAQTRLRFAEKDLTELERQKREADELQMKRDAAETEFGYAKKLAEALGRNGLQARIVQQAQDDIKDRANETLSRLSDGEWAIDLKDLSDSELEIQAHNLRQDSMRPFEYLSGGEKFRVAISLAVAIGQSIIGGRAADTLIIDEGFGALDETNRGFLVDELKRLSDEVLHGGRIVVVSHQDDVTDAFGSRYCITKDKDGCVSLESTLSG